MVIRCVFLQLAFLIFFNITYVKFIPEWYMYKISLMVGICLYKCQFIHLFSSQWKFSPCQNWHHCQQYVVSILVHLHIFQCFPRVLLLDWGLYLVLFYFFLFYWFESYIAYIYIFVAVILRILICFFDLTKLKLISIFAFLWNDTEVLEQLSSNHKSFKCYHTFFSCLFLLSKIMTNIFFFLVVCSCYILF